MTADMPPLRLYLTDPGRAAAEYALMLAARPLRPTLPRGHGQPVLVLPGLMASDTSTRPLRHLLRELGYHVHGWRLGRNVGPTSLAVNGMRKRLRELREFHGAPITIIGWSLGGIYARDLARQAPDAVQQVITLGSPFRLTHDGQTRASKMFNRFSHLHVERRDLPLDRDAGPLPVPTTSVYSRGDGIVAWQACLNPPSPRAENVAVVGSHIGLGHNPAVLWVIADRLAQPADDWRPFKAPVALRPLFAFSGTAAAAI